MKKVLLIAAMALMTVAASAQQKFGHVSFQSLIVLTTDYTDAMKQMNALQNEANETYQTMIEEYQSKATQYQQKASTWTDAIRESKARELQDIEQRIGEFQQSIQAELAQKEQELVAPIQQKVQDAVTKVAKAGGYIYIFDPSSLPYIDESQSKDIAPDVKKELGIPANRTLEDVQNELAALAQ